MVKLSCDPEVRPEAVCGTWTTVCVSVSRLIQHPLIFVGKALVRLAHVADVIDYTSEMLSELIAHCPARQIIHHNALFYLLPQ